MKRFEMESFAALVFSRAIAGSGADVTDEGIAKGISATQIALEDYTLYLWNRVQREIGRNCNCRMTDSTECNHNAAADKVDCLLFGDMQANQRRRQGEKT